MSESKYHDWCQAVLDGDLRWTQWCEGYSTETLEEAMTLVTRHGIKVRNILCSRFRHLTLLPYLKVETFLPERDGDSRETFAGCEFLVQDLIPDDVLYVIGDVWPPTPESVAVMIWRRPRTWMKVPEPLSKKTGKWVKS